jgi:hypothetical protein
MNHGFPIIGEFNRAKYERTKEVEHFPQMFIPWEMIRPHNGQCMANHGGQTLERIAQRGGLGRCEAIAVLADQKWTPIDADIADEKLKAMVEEYQSKQRVVFA